MARKRVVERPVIPKEFENTEEIDRGIARIRACIKQVEALDPTEHESGGQEKRNAEDAIHSVVLHVFGPDSPQYDKYKDYTIWHGGYIIGAPDWEYQKRFSDGIPQARTMLEGLIGYLENEKQFFVKPVRAAAPEQSKLVPAAMHIRGDTVKVALGNFTEQNVSAHVFLKAIEDAVERSSKIPQDDKTSLLQKIRELVKNPYVVGLGSHCILEALKKLGFGG